MIRRIKMLFKVTYNKFLQTLQPIQYAKKLGVTIEDTVQIYGVTYWGSEPWLISVGGGTIITDNVRFITHDGAVAVVNKEKKYKDIIKFGRIDIGKNCFIGVGVIILPDVIIGDSSIVGSGSVVVKDIPAGEVWAGNPAKFICTTQQFADKCIETTPPYDADFLEINKKDASIIIAEERRKARLSDK